MSAQPWGSSPLARGGLVDWLRVTVPAGLIPARAGRTTGVGCATSTARAHPRSRGADAERELDVVQQSGSSPLARGGQATIEDGATYIGLIPARAGRTCPLLGSRPAQRAHPRSRGADRDSWIPWASNVGSSPLARGGLPWAVATVGGRGLIPARAGRTAPSVTEGARSWAHPRSRGADFDVSVEQVGVRGSSPLARGGRHGSPCRV